MKFLSALLVLTLCTAIYSREKDSSSDTAPSYYSKWTMVKMWPQPQGLLHAEEVAELKRSERKAPYTIAHYNGQGELRSVEEIADGKRRVKFVYVYNASGEVVRIDLHLADGQTKVYYDRYGKVPPKK